MSKTILFIVFVALAYYAYTTKYKVDRFDNTVTSIAPILTIDSDTPQLYHFVNSNAINIYKTMVVKLGAPTMKVDSPHGAVLWNGVDYWTNIMLLDDSSKPLSATVHVNIPDKSLLDVLMVAKTITYNRYKKELTVAGDSLEEIVATVWIALNVLSNDVVTVTKELPEALIRSKESPNYKKMYNEILDIITKHNP